LREWWGGGTQVPAPEAYDHVSFGIETFPRKEKTVRGGKTSVFPVKDADLNP